MPAHPESPKRTTGLLLVLILALPLASLALAVPPDASVTHLQDPCPRNAPRAFPPGSFMEIDEGEPPCRLVFRPTGVRLEATVDGSRPDPGPTVVMDGRGRFYSTNARGFISVLSVWDPEGNYLTSFGGVGEGPGELRRQPGIRMFVDGEDRLHVWESGAQWSTFSADHEFISRNSLQVQNLVLDSRMTVFLDNGEVLTGDPYQSDRRNFFRVFGADGTLARSFGPVDEEMARSPEWPLNRVIAHNGGDGFWATPIPDGDEEYLIEEWGTDGELRRAVRGQAPWFVWRDDGVSLGGIIQFNVDDDEGLLYIIYQRLTDEGVRIMRQAMAADEPFPRDKRYTETEVIIQMIDLRAGELLASEVHRTSDAMEFLPRTLFPGVMKGPRPGEGPDGLPFVEIVAVELEAK